MVPGTAQKRGGKDHAGAVRLKAGNLTVPPRCRRHRSSANQSNDDVDLLGVVLLIAPEGEGYEEVA